MEPHKTPPERHSALHDPKLPRLHGEYPLPYRLVNRRSERAETK